MEEKVRVKRPHRLNMEDRKRIDFTGITDVVSFDPVKVVLESDYGHITIKGEGLHVNRLSVEKGELDLDGRVDSVCYSGSTIPSSAAPPPGRSSASCGTRGPRRSIFGSPRPPLSRPAISAPTSRTRRTSSPATTLWRRSGR